MTLDLWCFVWVVAAENVIEAVDTGTGGKGETAQRGRIVFSLKSQI